jgi:hypothetical protein
MKKTNVNLCPNSRTAQENRALENICCWNRHRCITVFIEKSLESWPLIKEMMTQEEFLLKSLWEDPRW